MSVYVPASTVETLKQLMIAIAKRDTDAAVDASVLIAFIVKRAANEALNQAIAEAKLLDSRIVGNVDNSLNFLGSEIADAEARVRQDVAEVMGGIITDLAEASGAINDEVANELTQAYDGIAGSHTTVGGLVETVIYATAEKFDKATEMVTDNLVHMIGLTKSNVENVVKGIRDATAKATQDALELILPAEAAEAVITWGKVLTSPSAFDFLDMGANKLFKRLDDFITIDVKEMKNWIKTINDAFTDQAWADMQAAKER